VGPADHARHDDRALVVLDDAVGPWRGEGRSPHRAAFVVKNGSEDPRETPIDAEPVSADDQPHLWLVSPADGVRSAGGRG